MNESDFAFPQGYSLSHNSLVDFQIIDGHREGVLTLFLNKHKGNKHGNRDTSVFEKNAADFGENLKAGITARDVNFSFKSIQAYPNPDAPKNYIYSCVFVENQ